MKNYKTKKEIIELIVTLINCYNISFQDVSSEYLRREPKIIIEKIEEIGFWQSIKKWLK